MSLKIYNNEQGVTYTLEAILGVSLILGTVIFATGNLPYNAQKTGEHSKVQLVNVGRDVLDLAEITSITDIFSNYSKSQGVNRTYTLVANKTIVAPGEPINFTLFYLDTDIAVKETVNLYKNKLGDISRHDTSWATYTCPPCYVINSIPSGGEYSIIAYDVPKINYSNAVTITVGNYYLDTGVSGIFETGDKNINGVVYYPNWTGAPDLNLQLLKNDGVTAIVNFTNKTSRQRLIEGFENAGQWTGSPGSTLTSGTNFREGNASVSINGAPNFWLKKTNSTSYGLFDYDNLSLDFYSNSRNENVSIELSKNNTSNKLIYNNITLENNGWNSIKFRIIKPDLIEGNITAQDVDTINISVSNATADNYFFDNLTAGAGSFQVVWPDRDDSGKNINSGIYFIRAIDSNSYFSNNHMIIYSGSNPGDSGTICCDSVIYETESVNITLYPNAHFRDFSPINQFSINGIKYDNNFDKTQLTISEPINPPTDTMVTLTAYTAGDYYINYHRDEGHGSSVQTNSILIRVLPFQSKCLFGDCKPKCSGLDMDDLNNYLRLFIPYYINYNLYLIEPDGKLCTVCPDFKEIINGYPTDEAVTVNKIFHIRTINGEGLKELRIVLWFK